MEKINIDNLCIDKTFKDFMESLRDEVDRRLNTGQEEPIPVTISLQARWFDFTDYDLSNFPPSSCIVWASINFEQNYFSIGEFEFARMVGKKKHLDSLVNVRLIDSLWSIESLREMQYELLRRFDPEWKTSDDYLH